MRKLLGTIAVILFSFSASAADVICSCPAEKECSDILISFVPSNPGVYMTVEYAYGESNAEGFATVTRNSENNKVVYKMGRFVLQQENGVYSLPGRDAICN